MRTQSEFLLNWMFKWALSQLTPNWGVRAVLPTIFRKRGGVQSCASFSLLPPYIFKRGSNASRSPSPKKLKESTVRNIRIPG